MSPWAPLFPLPSSLVSTSLSLSWAQASLERCWFRLGLPCPVRPFMHLHPLGTLGLPHCQLPTGTSSAPRLFLLLPWSQAAVTQLQGTPFIPSWM